MAKKQKTIKERKDEIKKDFASLPGGDVEQLKKIIQKMYRYDLDPGTVISGKYIDFNQRLDITEEQKLIIISPPVSSLPASGGTVEELWWEADPDAKRDLAKAYADSLYRYGVLRTDKTCDSRLFKILDEDNRVVVHLPGTERAEAKIVKTDLAKAIMATPSAPPSPDCLNDMFNWWSIHGEQIKGELTEEGYSEGVLTCTSIIYENDPEYKDAWSLYKSPYKPDSAVQWPLIRETLDRMTDPEAFSALIWGVYSRRYKGRQVLWLYGEKGEEGKSYFVGFLGKKLFGLNAGFKAASSSQLNGKRPFTNATYVGARLVVYPDCNNPNVLENEHMKEMSGGGRDAITTEEKFKAANTTTIDARFVICSNKKPFVRRDQWYRSRLLFNSIRPLNGPKDATIDVKYEVELNGFLAYAKDCYEKLCPNDEAIQVNPITISLVEKMIEEADPLNKDIFTRNFTLDPKGVVPYKKLTTVLEELENLKNTTSQKEFREYLESLPGVTIVRLGAGMSYKGLSLKTKTETTPDSGDEEISQRAATLADLGLIL